MARFEHYIDVGTQRLRCGYTTGTCATAAALAATMALVEGRFPTSVTIQTPADVAVEVEILQPELTGDVAQCAVCKDGGDDPDATHGQLIVATVERCEILGIHIDGGQGVGRVSRAGLDQAVGHAAINATPRRMIAQALSPYLQDADFGLQVTISVPNGAVVAQKTFNPRLGIVGGISILGTSGLVRPMSQRALQESIRVEIRMIRATGATDLILTPGNYGEDFSRDVLGLSMTKSAICSNYLGFALDCAVAMGFETVLVVGHLGKLAKVSAGAMDTHSKTCDGRREALCTHAALCGGDRELIQGLYHTIATDGAVELLKQAELLTTVMASLATALEENLTHRGGGMNVQGIFFSNQYGILGQTSGAETLRLAHQQ